MLTNQSKQSRQITKANILSSAVTAISVVTAGGCAIIDGATSMDISSFPRDSSELTKEQILTVIKDYAKIEGESAVSVGTLANEFETNSINAEEKYTNQAIKVVGRIESVDNDLTGGINVALFDPSEEFSFDSVSCLGVTKKTAKTLSKDQIATVYGFVTTTDLGVKLNWCYFGEKDGVTPSAFINEINSK
jgi:hypothetical protein